MYQRTTAVSLFLLTACSQPAPSSRQTAPEQPRVAAPSTTTQLTQRCSNAQSGFSISYPAGWRTNDASVLPACSVFDPADVELPRESEVPFDIAIVIGAQDHPFEPAPASTQYETVLSSQLMKIAGRDAVRVEVESTGEGLADRGMRSLRFVLDLGGGRTLVATTNDTGESYARQKEILAQMVETLSVP